LPKKHETPAWTAGCFPSKSVSKLWVLLLWHRPLWPRQPCPPLPWGPNLLQPMYLRLAFLRNLGTWELMLVLMCHRTHASCCLCVLTNPLDLPPLVGFVIAIALSEQSPAHTFSNMCTSSFIVCIMHSSGYPGDERTKSWLLAHMDKIFGFPSIVRFSWSTCSKLLKEKAVAVDWYSVLCWLIPCSLTRCTCVCCCRLRRCIRTGTALTF
jgi:hypothetical protein